MLPRLNRLAKFEIFFRGGEFFFDFGEFFQDSRGVRDARDARESRSVMIYYEIARFSAGKREGWGIMGGTGVLGNGEYVFGECFFLGGGGAFL